MFAALNAASFAPELPLIEQLEQTRAAGFEGIELVATADGALRADFAPQDCAPVAARAAELHLQMTGVASALYFKTHFAAPSAAGRQAAVDLTLRLLDLAAALGAPTIVIVPAVVGRATDATPTARYADAFNYSFDALSRLRFDAESRGVCICIENVWNRFLLSPLEMADLIDRVNSPCVRVCFDTGNMLPFGYPQDWIETLGQRIARVHAKDYDLNKPGRAGFCPLGEGHVDWPAVMHALCDAGYDNAVVYEGGGTLAEAAVRLGRILAGESPTPAAIVSERA